MLVAQDNFHILLCLNRLLCTVYSNIKTLLYLLYCSSTPISSYTHINYHIGINYHIPAKVSLFERSGGACVVK